MFNAMRVAVVLTLLAVSSLYAADRYPTVADYRLDVSFEPNESWMEGVAEINFDPATPLGDTISFFFHGELSVDSILQSGQPVDWAQESILYMYDYSRVAVQVKLVPPTPDSFACLKVFYQGYFNPSKARSPSDYMRIDSTGVYLRAYYYSPWFPIFEEPDGKGYTVDFEWIRVSCPSEYIAVAVGHLLEERVEAGRRVSTWQAEDIHLSEAQCTAQRFERFSEGEVTVYSWKDSASIAAAESIMNFVAHTAAEYTRRYRNTAAMKELHIIEMPRFGDISSENMTSITFDAWRRFDEETWPRRFLGHELVHPFVSVPVDYDDPLVALVIEGFPAYFHLPVLKESLGDEWYFGFLKRLEDGYLEAKKTGLNRRGRRAPEERPIDRISFDEIGSYKDNFVLGDRAPLFFEFLRREMGEKVFGAFCSELFNLPEIDYAKFKNIVSKHAPELTADVDLWLSTNEYPERWRLPAVATNP